MKLYNYYKKYCNYKKIIDFIKKTYFIIRFSKYEIAKIISIYVLLILIFNKFNKNNQRCILTFIVFLLSLYLFKVPIIQSVLYFILGCIVVFSEHIYIKYMKKSWKYNNPDILQVPLWLIPLWCTCVIIIIQCSKIISKF